MTANTLPKSFVRTLLSYSCVSAFLSTIGCATTPKEQPCDACWVEDGMTTVAGEIPTPDPLQVGLDNPLESEYVPLAQTDQLPTAEGELTQEEVRLTDHHEIMQADGATPVGAGPFLANHPNLATPSIQGVHLGGQQITATEHALRLKEELAKTQKSNESLTEENTRLKKRLDEADELLAKVTDAMALARQELSNAKFKNEKLEQEVLQLRKENQRSQANTKLLLDSIKQELDDVLMREIALGEGG